MANRHETENQFEQNNLSYFSWMCKCIKLITLEPCVFIFFFAMSMEGLLCSEIVLKKTCFLYLNYSAEICDNITAYEDEEINVEKNANIFLMYGSLIQSIPSILFVLFIGPWSDKHGRKLPIILPFCGKVIFALLMWVYTTFWEIPAEYIILTAVPIALTGGLPCLIMSMYSYITDISTPENRTTRIMIVDIFIIIGPCIGLLLSNVTKAYLGFNGTFVVTGTLYLVCTFYIFFLVKETRGTLALVPGSDQELMPSFPTCLKDLYNYENIVQTFTTTFKERPNYGRRKIVCLIVSLCLMVFVFSSMSIEYLYTKLKFDWIYEEFIYWSVTAIFLQSVGMLVLFPLLSKVLKINEDYLAISGCISIILANFTQAFAFYGYHMYIGNFLGILGGLPLAIGRSMLSKLVPMRSTGKLFSVVAALESLLPLMATPLYTITYNFTISSFPGAFFVISSAFYFLAGIFFVMVNMLNRGDTEVDLIINEERESDQD